MFCEPIERLLFKRSLSIWKISFILMLYLKGRLEVTAFPNHSYDVRLCTVSDAQHTLLITFKWSVLEYLKSSQCFVYARKAVAILGQTGKCPICFSHCLTSLSSPLTQSHPGQACKTLHCCIGVLVR